jgi:hypothetical protein
MVIEEKCPFIGCGCGDIFPGSGTNFRFAVEMDSNGSGSMLRCKKTHPAV